LEVRNAVQEKEGPQEVTVMLYKHPGPHRLHGDMFDYIIAEEDDVAACVADGWHLTTTEAKAGVEPVADSDVARLRELAGGDKRRKDVREAIALLEEMGHGLD
jgi:hypothetical protein